VQPHLLSAAQRSLNNIQETLCDLYGNEVNEVFKSDSDQYIGWTDVVNRNNIQEDDDDWFDDEDDIDDMVKKGVVDSSFFNIPS
jgi:hypothetical protein